MHNIETSNVLLPVCDDPYTTHVATSRDHDGVTSIKVDEVGNFVVFKVKLDGIVGLDGRVLVTDGSAVMGDNMGNTTSTNSHPLDLQELV